MTISKLLMIAGLALVGHVGNIHSSESGSPAKKIFGDSKIAALYLSGSPTPSSPRTPASPRTPSLSENEEPKRSLSKEEKAFQALHFLPISKIAQVLDEQAKAKAKKRVKFAN